MNHLRRIILVGKYLENKFLLIWINFNPKTSHSCLKKNVLSYVFQVVGITKKQTKGLGPKPFVCFCWWFLLRLRLPRYINLSPFFTIWTPPSWGGICLVHFFHSHRGLSQQIQVILLMVQKSQGQPPGMVLKPCLSPPRPNGLKLFGNPSERLF